MGVLRRKILLSTAGFSGEQRSCGALLGTTQAIYVSWLTLKSRVALCFCVKVDHVQMCVLRVPREYEIR